MRWFPGVLAAGLVACLLSPAGGSAQDAAGPPTASEPRVGVVLGATFSRQVWDPAVSTSDRTGGLLGAYVEVPFPGSVFAVRAGAQWVQRGGLVEADRDGTRVDGEVRSDYLSVPVHLVLSAGVGPLRLLVFGGPTVETFLSRRTDPVLNQFFDEDGTTVLNGAFGAGLELPLGRDARLEVEGRWTEGLSTALSGPFTTVRNRSREALLRVSLPLARLQGNR